MRLPLVVIAAAGVLAGGCVLVEHEHRHPAPVVVHKPGPPPHAPAHGYRRKHQQDNVQLVFDSGVGVYVVVGQSECWWNDDHYYRWRDGAWFSAVRVSGPWKVVEVNVVPGGLRSYKVKAKGGGKGKAKHGPASHGRKD